MKTMMALFFCLFSINLFANDCAQSTAELKSLVGNSAFPITWIESGDKNPFTLKISERNNMIHLSLSTKEGLWAKMDTRVCRKNSEKFVAEVNKIEWGPAAPGVARGRSVKEVGISLPYQSTLKVSISIFWKGQFEPHY